MNDFNFCTMQIGLMYPNMSSLNKILEIESLLYNIGIKYNINFDVESFISEWRDFTNFNRFKNNNELLKYNLEKYMPNVKVNIFWSDDTSTKIALNCYIGSYDINVATFQFLSERLWPDLLQIHTYVLSKANQRGNAYYEVEFNTNDILSLYNGMTYVEAVNEFISDLSLFMTYNNLGKINLNEEPALSKDMLSLKIIQFIF